MSYYPVTGSRFFVSDAAGLASALTVSALTNGSPPTATTSTSHSYVDNDEVLMLSGWEDIDQSVFRVNALAANTFSLDGYDTSSTDWYPAGSGTGTCKKVTTWLEMGQVLGVQNQGGGERNITVNPVNKRNGIRIPVGFEPASLSFTLGYDPARSDQVSLMAASRILGKRAFKFALPGGGYAYCYGTVAMSQVPTFDTNSVMQISVSVGIDGLFTMYSA